MSKNKFSFQLQHLSEPYWVFLLLVKFDHFWNFIASFDCKSNAFATTLLSSLHALVPVACVIVANN